MGGMICCKFMKKTIFILLLAAGLSACGSQVKDAGYEQTDTVGEKQSADAIMDVEGAGKVYTQTDDNAYSPGKKVDVPTIIDFNATWCGPCQAFKPVFDAAAKQYPQVRFVSADVDRLPEMAEAYGIRAVPTLVFISPDGNIRKAEGFMNAEDFSALIDSFLNK